ncbi:MULTISPECIES: YkgJ family cysteine cluster protein [unclassified Leptolyngbya]|uniref:YkgJ family cysteine cluster protein n=1 Tax=unclassified Leptolyngbya TaxID=2650499 RepID=UPI001682EE4A|nr:MULTISPECIES: YkgJ family cysteine cluster protein [unclassified Leptolyngbya]MBD1913984.1 YkgJ family cysteine cluster protein [Leptolyngbya sp. FACHB-8]MBD2154394.1 YkgJ family cysteine cluster protein [Leptolyngbya sp. FACHB-16]
MDERRQLLHDLDDRIESRVQAIRAERDWWPCQRGCDHCCRHLAHPPELSAVEWERVDAAVALLSTTEQMVVKQRIEHLLEQIADGTLSSAVVCPFLNESEGACRIYDSRPIACRTYGFFVARSHDQYCKQIEGEVSDRPDDLIIWGNADAISNDIKRISGEPIPFDVHYG